MDLKSFLASMGSGLICRPYPPPQREPIAYLYNGVQLPPLPEWDREMYPYAVIYVENQMEFLDGTICLSFVDSKLSYDDGNNSLTIDRSTEFQRKIYRFRDGSWVETAEGAKTSIDMRNHGSMVWSNYDVPNIETGNVHLSATDPIPVYE